MYQPEFFLNASQMKFTEKKAEEIIAQHDLAPGTLQTWKRREAIPDKYNNDLPEPITDANELQQVKHLIRAFQTEKLKHSPICRLAGLESRHPLFDTLRGKSVISRAEFIALKKAINTLRNQVKEVLELLSKKAVSETGEKKLSALLQRKEIAWFVVFERNRPLWGKFEGWTGGRRSFPEDEVEKLNGLLLVFLQETTI